ncbi:MAG: dihydrolipoyllysine-residue succinyltransferase [Acidobacteria bacterium]|nr:MAG: dihydrolipoyllysine-residue succinyltransferase [Acidobacteriota bacterium]
MKIDIVVPQAGESVTEAMVGEWLKEEGDLVQMDDPIVEMETDKSNLELAAEASGKLHIAVETGTVVAPGDTIGTIDTSFEAGEDAESEPAAAETTETKEAEVITSPAARRIITEENLNASDIVGTGKDGRITKEDAINQAAASSQKEAPAAVKAEPAPKKTATPPKKTAHSEGKRTVPMSMMRRRIAKRLVEAQQTAAILTTFNEIDMTAVMTLRSKYKDAFFKKHGVKLGFMSFFIKASIEALKAVPEINAEIEDQNLIYKDYCHIGVAVGTEKGLVVPVIKHADEMSFHEIEQAIADYAEKARQGKIAIEDLQDGTFTLSNGGTYGSLLSTPILNPPQSGILGMHKIEKRAVVVNDDIVIRPMMYVALSYDHRIVDGKGAVTFLVKIKECLEDPARLLLGV